MMYRLIIELWRSPDCGMCSCTAGRIEITDSATQINMLKLMKNSCSLHIPA